MVSIWSGSISQLPNATCWYSRGDPINTEFVGIGAALGSAASWAAGSFLFKRIGDSVSPFGMTFVKGGIGVVFLIAVLSLVGSRTIETESLLYLGLSGILGIAVADTLFFAALQDLGPVALVVFFMMGQIVTALMALMWLGEMPSLRSWVGIGVTLAGVGAVLWPRLGSNASLKRSGMRGVILGSISMLCMSASTVVAKPALESVSTIMATLVRMISGTVSILFFGLATNRLRQWLHPVRNMRLIARFVFSVAVVTFGGFWLSLVAIKYLDVAIAATLSATEPLFVIPLAFIFFHERISLLESFGAVCAFLGVMLLII
jgi:drug/metabolite transporter (DMT)-like permease